MVRAPWAATEKDFTMIVLFTDFGTEGPYVGQLKVALAKCDPDQPVVDLMHDAPTFDPKTAAYLLAALAEQLPVRCVCLGVVDPGVGNVGRRPIMVRADDRWFVGPDNGLFAIVSRRAQEIEWYEIDWRPDQLSATFHGRDLFAPVAAALTGHEPVDGTRLDPATVAGADWLDDLGEVVYIDTYGNAMTGMRASTLPSDAVLKAGRQTIPHARTFSDVAKGMPIWYENSNGLVELAVNQGRADDLLRLSIGTPVLALASS